MGQISNGGRSPEIRRDFERSGAGFFCAILAETYLNRARRNLTALKGKSYRVESFEHLVESVEIKPQEVLVA